VINIRDALDFLERAKKALIDDDMTYEDYDECISLLMTAPASVQRRNDALIEMMEDSGFLYHKLDQIDARLKEMA